MLKLRNYIRQTNMLDPLLGTHRHDPRGPGVTDFVWGMKSLYFFNLGAHAKSVKFKQIGFPGIIFCLSMFLELIHF